MIADYVEGHPHPDGGCIDRNRNVPDVRDRGSNCVVCGRPAPRDYAIVAANEHLCLAECFGWFSGYPWVLFEMGMLTTFFEFGFMNYPRGTNGFE